MKYDFTKENDDLIKLTYKDKEFDIHKDIDLLRRLASIQQRAKIRMLADLKKDGLTASDLEIEKHEGGKTIVDKSSLLALEKDYLDLVATEVLNEITQKYTNMGLTDLLEDIGLKDDEAKDFAFSLLYALKGEESPSDKKQ